MSNEIVIVEGCRSPIGGFGGAFKKLMPSELAEQVVNGLVSKAKIEKDSVNEIILGHCIQRTDDANTARVVALNAGFPKETTGVTVQRQCSSGMQAIIQGYHELFAGDVDVVIAGGVEVMSSSPYILKQARWGQRLQHSEMNDTVWEILTDPVVGILMGETAENLAEKYDISREEQDEVSVRSHQNAIHAIENGTFQEEIIPIEVTNKKKKILIDNDEHPRKDIAKEKIESLKPIFRENGTVTAANSSGINDGAAAVLMMNAEKARQEERNILGTIVSYAWSGVEPEIMGYGPVPAIKTALNRAGLTLDDIELIEINEAFAAQYITCEKLLQLNRNIVNVNGSGIALGHPIGATGARIVVTLLHEMKRRSLKYGLAALCVGGGMGMAILLKR